MKNGTYAEAKKAGFSEQRAVFLDRMCHETKEGAKEEMLEKIGAYFHIKKKLTAKEKDERFKEVFMWIGLGVSCIAAVALVLTIVHYFFNWAGTVLSASLGIL